MLNKISVPKPPIEEQKEIASIINGFKSHAERSKDYRERLKRLKQGLMQDLLSGEVRTHDRDIEIVEDVLEHG